MTDLIRICAIAVAASFAVALPLRAAQAGGQVYQYEVEHPSYGHIGTYTNTITKDGNAVKVQTALHVVVKMLGIPVFRQDAQRVEKWRDGRLVAFTGATDDNGKQIDISGQAQGNRFVIEAPTGTVTAPPQVHPSNPWAPQVLDTDTMMSTKTGKVQKVTVTDQGMTNVTFDGKQMRLRQYVVQSDKRQMVWLDARGIVVAFQTEEGGSAINFVLKNPPPPAPQQQASQ